MITVPQLLAPVDPEAPLLVVATREEAEHLGVDAPVLLTGIGRINATAALAETLARGPRPATILNVGTAGSLYDGPANSTSGPSLAGVHRISRVILHDFSHSAVRRLAGADAYPAIDLDVAAEAVDETSSSKILATGDLFVEDSATRARLAETADLVDMEGYAIAWVARRFGVPVELIKLVSDPADESAGKLWSAGVEECSKVLGEHLGGRFGEDPPEG
ncbi:nucleosidase [Corynebacterium xerosis]|uniref:nucleosidase n=1 Tax=Corynebacterium xerosis TaxID=1725 RepID=UPI00366D1782